MFYQNDFAMRDTADVTCGKPIGSRGEREFPINPGFTKMI
jgi:hypothetical protein